MTKRGSLRETYLTTRLIANGRGHFGVKIILDIFPVMVKMRRLSQFDTEVKFHGRNEQNRKSGHQESGCEYQRAAVLRKTDAGGEDDEHDRQGARHDVAVR